MNKVAWIREFPGQLVITSSQIKWTNDTGKNLADFEIDPSKEYPIRKQRKLHQKYINRLVDKVRDRITDIDRLKLVALITVEQHAREVLDKLVDKQTGNPRDFLWVQQLRFERDESSDSEALMCNIKQTNTHFPYGYEYQGNNGRLVVTPLTDRCYMTLTTALHLKRGGAPQGPAGTGKTETVKDLGKNMAKYVIVINCSESLDFLSLRRLFSGLSQSGAWGCFDEFNRIEIEVLSVVAQQISTIQTAIQIEATEFRFEGKMIKLNMTCGIFVTMNPGYAGRSELPDNLKSLFRPISMMKADLALICEIKLLSEGFRSGKSLSKKTVTLYRLMVQQFSKQDHYDYGMRALNSVLICAGNLKREQPDLDENVLLMKAIHDMNIPKWVEEDIPLFYSLLNVIFYGVRLNESENQTLKNAIIAELELNSLQPTDNIVLKCMQLFDTKRTRHGNMLVGQALSGKTTIWRTLFKVMNKLAKSGEAGFHRVFANCMNPKSITLNELYGWYDTSGEWYDGILSNIMRNICQVETEEFHWQWFVIDGPVDTSWIESMNSTLDDSKLLTLVNGDRISLPPTVRMLFEVENLAVASPATVSRCGMIYVDVKVQGYQPYFTTWLKRKGDTELEEFIQNLFEKFCVRILEVKRLRCRENIKTTQINNVISLTKIFDAFFQTGGVEKNDDRYWVLLEKWFIFSLLWSIGGSVDEDSRFIIDDTIKDIDSGFPHGQTLYEYTINLEKLDWQHWSDKLTAKYTINPGTPFHKIIVPTVDTVRNIFLLNGLVKSGRNTLVVGRTGTGKTVLIQGMLSVLDENKYCSFTINFSAQTTAGKTQDIIENSLEKRTSNKRGPPAQKHCIMFVDDLNMPRYDLYKSQPPLELLRQWVDYGYWYDRQKQMPLYVLDTQILAAMGPPGGGRADISQRFQAQFNLINFTIPSEASVYRIFINIIQHHLSDFEEEVKPLSEPLTQATINLYGRVTELFLPTPTKSHYVFNLRDISKVFQGMYRADRGYHDSKDSILKLWSHECLRVFHDRLISYADRDIFKKLIDDQLESQLGSNYNSCCLKIVENEKEILIDPLFVDFLDEGSGLYEEVSDREALRAYLEQKLDDYNSLPQNIEMNLVLFKEAVSQMCKINRVIKQTRGHCLLVGVGGSGRHSLTRLATYVAGYDLVQLEINKSYRVAEFREDIKRMNEKAGVSNRPIVFLFSDNDVVNEAFLEDVNNILSAGEVPNIYNPDEQTMLRESVRKSARDNKIIETPDNLFNFFMSRVRDNLHVSFCLSPIGDNFRNYLRMYPGLVNNTTINWFMPWPEDALFEVAKSFLAEKSEFDESMNFNLASIFCKMHMSVTQATKRYHDELKRLYYVTPTNYLELVLGYLRLLVEKQKEVGDSANKLRNGLGKLEDARLQVEHMSIELEGTKSEVSKKQRLCEELVMTINQQQQNAEKAQKEVERETEKIDKEKKEVEIVAIEAQSDLEKAMPALMEAESALEKLEKSDVAEVKAYSSPPEPVMNVMEAVMIVFGKTPNWATAKKELSDASFLQKIKTYDTDNIKDRTLKQIEKYTKRPGFTPAEIYRVSRAASALCQWIHALESYAKIYRDVEPKRQNLAYLRGNLKKMEERLFELTEKLREINELVAGLNQQLLDAKEDMESYKSQANELQLKLERAEKLVSGLATERVRWESQLLNFDEELKLLPGDCLLSAAFMSYNGPFTSEYRDDLVDNIWLPLIKTNKIPMNREFTFTSFMAKPTEIRDWNMQKLPTDRFSTENGILTVKTRRWALMIDPQSQANAWIRNMEGSSLKVADPKESRIYMPMLEQSIRMGDSMLLQNIEEEIDPSLDPVLNQSVQKRGKSFVLKLGDKELSYNFNFKFYLTTKMANPVYPPEISTKVVLINFQVKEAGLEEQLLGIVVGMEEPKLEGDKDRLVMSISENNKTLIEKEDLILQYLNESTGSLLDDEVLIDTLQESKETAESVKHSLEIAETNMKKITGLRENYRPCATRASVLFFVLSGLVKIDPMYQFSLYSYIDLFKDSIKKSKEKNPIWDSIAERIQLLDKYHMYSVYATTCLALFERHKLLLSMQICVELSKLTNEINMEEYNFLLRGGIVIGDAERTPNPDPEWITQEMWENITELNRTVETFLNIEGALVHYRREWKRWYQTSEPENQPLPGEWDAKADDLRKLVLLRCLRPDRVIFAVKSYVAGKIGPEYVEYPNLELDKVVKENSKSTVPMIFVLHPGVDPLPLLAFLAKERGKDLETIPLGKGQASKAINAFNEACEKGYWVFLANCHLSISWMPDLEKLIENKLINERPHEEFRLWLSSDTHPKFPISILQRAIKMTTEPPRGLRSNMLRLYNTITERHFNRIVDKERPKYKKLLYALCWYHSLLLERKKFKSLGWNQLYSFNDSDFEVCENIIAMYLGNQEEKNIVVDTKNIPWDAIQYLIGEVSYGGRVTDERDRRLMKVYTEEYFNSAVIEESKYMLSGGNVPYMIPDDTNVKLPPDITNPAHFYREYIKNPMNFPAFERPEAFGQHVNAEIASQRSDTKDLLNSILILQPQVVTVGEESREDNVNRRATELIERMPEPLHLEEIIDRWRRDDGPLKVVLIQEISRYNILLERVRDSIRELQRGIKGLVVISSDLEAVMNSMYENKVPIAWKFAYKSVKPLASWVRDLEARIKQLKDWAYGSTPIVYWISGFTFPTGFTTALKQQAAERQQCSIDNLVWDYVVQKIEEQSITNAPREGAFVKGLYLEGAKWNLEDECLCEPEPMELNWLMPVILFRPIKDKKKKQINIYKCPCYIYPVREGTVESPSYQFSVTLKTGEHPPEFWIKRGTALLMQLDV